MRSMFKNRLSLHVVSPTIFTFRRQHRVQVTDKTDVEMGRAWKMIFFKF